MQTTWDLHISEHMDELEASWREDAETLRRRGVGEPADALESAADDLEDRREEIRREKLSPQEAAEEAGLTPERIRAKIREGELPNAGEKGSPSVRRYHLHAWLEAPKRRDPDGEQRARELLNRTRRPA